VGQELKRRISATDRAKLIDYDPVVLVSGGTQGIGFELVRKLYNEGKKVATFARSSDQIDLLRREFPDRARFFAEALDLTDYAAVTSFVQKSERELGPITHLINNAGVTGALARAEEIGIADIQRTVNINLVGTAHLASEVLKAMKQRQIPGVIVNVSSGSAKGVPGLSVYSATKAGLNVFTRATAAENKPFGIRIFSLNPGHVETRLQAAARETDPAKFPSAEKFRSFKEHGNVRDPRDTANEITYLLENPTQFRTGSNVSYRTLERKIAAREITSPALAPVSAPAADPAPATGPVLFNEAEIQAARAEAIERMGPDAATGVIWKRFEPVEIDGHVISPAKDLIDLEQRVLKEIHQRIAASERPIVRIRIQGRNFAVYRRPYAQGMAGAVYEIADSGKVIKISKSMPLSIPSMLQEKGRAAQVEALTLNERFRTPHNYDFDEFGIFGVKEKVSGPTLTEHLIDLGLIRLEDVDGKTRAVLESGEKLEALLKTPEVKALAKEVENLMDIRHRHPELVGDLGPANIIPKVNLSSGKIEELYQVDIGLTSQKTKARFDGVYPEGFRGYLRIAEALVNRYIDTHVMPAVKAMETEAVHTVSQKSARAASSRDLKFPAAEEKFLEREAQSEYPVTTAVKPEYLPGAGKFPVGYLRIPAEELHVVDSGLGSLDLRSLMFEEINGKKFIRFPVHPDSEHLYQPLIDKYGWAGEYVAGATSSTRVVLAHDLEHGPDQFGKGGQLKLSLDQYQSKRSRIVPAWEVRRSVGVTELLSKTPHEKWLESGASVIPEVAGAYIPASWKRVAYVDAKQPEVLEHGFILRDKSFLTEIPDAEVHPLFELFAKRGKKPPLVIELWKKSGEPDFHRFIDQFLFKPFIAKSRYLMFHEGVIPEIHFQNVSGALKSKAGEIAHFFHRDGGSMKVDLRMRWIHDLPVGSLRSDNAAFDFKFERATSVIEEAFNRYFHDETFVRGSLETIREYVPDFDPEKTRALLNQRLKAEVENQFPLKKPDTEKSEPWSVKGHLNRYYAENPPKNPRAIWIPTDPAQMRQMIRRQIERGQVMELPASWRKTLKIPREGYLVTDYGVVYSSDWWLDSGGKPKLMLAFNSSEPWAFRRVPPSLLRAPATKEGDFKKIVWDQDKKERALKVMLRGSAQVSRTVVISGKEVADLAEKNYQNAARYVIEHFEALPINRDTAVYLNRMLTEGLVHGRIRGNPNARLFSQDAHLADKFVGRLPEGFYQWLDTEDAKKVFENDPVRFAEILHHNIGALDSFFDGNGRLSRLFADLALLKSGRAPAYYTEILDYFKRGVPRAAKSYARYNRPAVKREKRIEYFREIQERGQRALDQGIEAVDQEYELQKQAQ
jgi:NAD(P)-dependent dehydrogenase (short-subunit alcohol dehydrogenase family)